MKGPDKNEKLRQSYGNKCILKIELHSQRSKTLNKSIEHIPEERATLFP